MTKYFIINNYLKHKLCIIKSTKLEGNNCGINIKKFLILWGRDLDKSSYTKMFLVT